jgi:hypothetical protein
LLYRLAGSADEADLRALLRAQFLPGWVSLAFTREPDYFAGAALEGERHAVILARDRGTGALAGMFSRGVRPVYLNGEARWLPYLGQLRVAPAYRGGYHRLREGFRLARQWLYAPDELPFELTSILADNRSAQRLLTAELPGMPRYAPLGELVTLALAARRRRFPGRVEIASPGDLPGIAECLGRNHRRYQLAPVWQPAQLNGSGVYPGCEDFVVTRKGGRVEGCAALWDQRRFKQTLVCGYRWPLGRLRPLVNLGGPLLGLPRLPAVGMPLRQAFVSHLAVDEDDPDALAALLRGLLARAAARDLDQLLLGLVAGHPWLALVRRRFRHLEYRSLLYLVHWPEQVAALEVLDGRPLHLELAVL